VHAEDSPTTLCPDAHARAVTGAAGPIVTRLKSAFTGGAW
jgi:hypothetical protein